jgi:acetylornithine aminotransferase
MTVAKGLAGGLPIGAILAGPRADVFEAGDHGSTFGGSPLTTAVAAAVIDTIDSAKLVENSARVGARLRRGLLALRERGAPIAGVRGRGLMLGVLLTEPIAADLSFAALEAGLMVNAVGASVIRLLPALTVTEAEADEAVSRLAAAFDVVAGLGDAGADPGEKR